MRDKLDEVLAVLGHRPQAVVIAIFGAVLCTVANFWMAYVASLVTHPLLKGIAGDVGQFGRWAGLVIFGLCVIAAIQRYQRDRDELWSRI